MCRIFACSDPSVFSLYRLTKLFENLELDAGGHGIGIGYIINGEPVVHKGDISFESAAKIVKGLHQPVLVHFRAASKGTKVEEKFNHPFIVNEGVFCQNGTVKDLVGVGGSDTEIISRLINTRGFDRTASFLKDFGVMVLLDRDNQFHVRQRGHGDAKRPWEEMIMPKAWIGCSNLECFRDSWFPMEEDEELQEEPVVMVEVDGDTYFDLFGEDAYWLGINQKTTVQIPLSIAEEFYLDPIVIGRKAKKCVEYSDSSIAAKARTF